MGVRLKQAALLTLPALANAVSLSDFSPRASGLPAACEAIYTERIPGCSAADFESTCSRACVKGLESLVQPIREACGGEGVHGENLIVAFLAGVGPEQLCKDAPDWPGGMGPPPTPGWSSTGTWMPATGTMPWASTITSGTLTVSSLPVSDTSSLLVDTSSTAATTTATTSKHKSTSTTSSSTTSSSSSSSNPQLNTHDHSGGGSPFDTAGNLMAGAATLSFSAAVMLLSASVTLFTALR